MGAKIVSQATEIYSDIESGMILAVKVLGFFAVIRANAESLILRQHSIRNQEDSAAPNAVRGAIVRIKI